MDATQPAGTYLLETEEELVQELSFPAYRRIATRLLLPLAPGSSIVQEVIDVDPLEFDAAQERDLTTGSQGGAGASREAGTA
jgi:hypothetical protein